MGKYICSICKKEKPFVTMKTWYKCTSHGVICNECRVKPGIIKTILFSVIDVNTDATCPKCGKTLKIL
jgi:hypothetical protein